MLVLSKKRFFVDVRGKLMILDFMIAGMTDKIFACNRVNFQLNSACKSNFATI